jgi:DNA-binding protein HU-beta
MNKAELIDAIAAEANLTKADAKRALDAFLSNTGKALKKGESVVLIGFGTFKTATRAARNGRNPQTGKVIKIKAKKVIHHYLEIKKPLLNRVVFLFYFNEHEINSYSPC